MHPFSSLHRPSIAGGLHTSQELPPTSLLVSPPSTPAAAHTSAPTTPVAIDATAVDEAALSLPNQTDSLPSAPDETVGTAK